MARQNWKPGTMIYPLPAVLVSCGTSVDDSNLITVAWTGTICTDPAMCYISVRPSRYSYDIIKSTMEFTINLTTESMARATDWAGVKSGREYDKWLRDRADSCKRCCGELSLRGRIAAFNRVPGQGDCASRLS